MSIQAGLVGLPNVGKSTLFNALTNSNAPAENYPFCTIDPHTAITQVPDERLEKLTELYGSAKKIPAIVTFVDIAGLVKGAASGEGLGNQFLSHIREVDLILHVLRCFEDANITHTSPTINPLADYEVICQELMLKDVESVEKRIERLPRLIKAASSNPQESKLLQTELDVLEHVKKALNAGNMDAIRTIATQAKLGVELLSAKNFLIIANVAEHELENDAFVNNPHYSSLVAHFGQERVVPISAKIEYELSQMTANAAQDMMSLLGMKERGLDKIIRQTYVNLGLITFFTCGPKEAHAWPIKKGITIRQASGEIHSDLERGFICADIFNYDDIVSLGSEVKVKESGKMRREGQHYIVQDGDIVHVKFNV